MKRVAAVCASLLLVAGVLRCQTVPELFQRVREQVRSSSWKDALETLDQLDAEASRPGNEAVRQQLAAPAAFYRGVCDANLDEPGKAQADFAAFQQAKPGSTIDKVMYSKKAVAAFEAAAREVASHDSVSSGSASLSKRFEEFQPASNTRDKSDDRWADGPVKWIMTPEETAAWSGLRDAAERAEFVESFWQARNPKPGSGDNPARAEFDRRVAFADAYFQLDERERGSLTAPGMVFVLLGPPTRAGRKPIDASEERSISDGASQDEKWWMGARNSIHLDGARLTDPSGSFRELWHYGREALPKAVSAYELDVVFVTKNGYGRAVLQRQPATLAALEAARAGSSGTARARQAAASPGSK